LILANYAFLVLQTSEQVALEHLELQVGPGLDDLQDHQRRYQVLPSNNLKGSLQVGLDDFILALEVSKVSQSLYPKIQVLGSVLSANFKDLFEIVLLDIIRQKALEHVEGLADLLDALRVVIDLEQEKHVVLVYLVLVPLCERIYFFDQILLVRHLKESLTLCRLILLVFNEESLQ
jgi:hypothetical protein